MNSITKGLPKLGNVTKGLPPLPKDLQAARAKMLSALSAQNLRMKELPKWVSLQFEGLWKQYKNYVGGVALVVRFEDTLTAKP